MGRSVLQLVLPVVLALSAASGRANAQPLLDELPKPVRGLEVVEHIGEKLPLDLEFTNSDGATVKLADYFTPKPGEPPKPAVVAMVYYTCPTACPAILSKMVESFQQLDFVPGQDFRTLVFSFKEEESTPAAAMAKARYTSEYGRPLSASAKAGWEFHSGSPEACQKLSDALGFPYRRLSNGEYGHPVSIFIVSPGGVISRYIYGYDYNPTMMKMALLEASSGKLARTMGERFVHYCYKWDPNAGTYTLQAFRLMQVGGALTVVVMAALIVSLRVGEVVRTRRRQAAAQSGVTGAQRIIVPGASS